MKLDPIVLDEHRGMAAQQATEIRRRLAEVEADQEALRERRTELEKFLLAAPASTWPEAAEKARYLIGLLATTSLARDPRRQKLIAGVLDDFGRLAGERRQRRCTRASPIPPIFGPSRQMGPSSIYAPRSHRPRAIRVQSEERRDCGDERVRVLDVRAVAKAR